MKYRTLLMAASAAVLMASPALAQCPDDLTQLEQEIQETTLAEDTAQRLQDRLEEARNAVQNDNINQCEDIVADIRSELEDLDMQASADMGADAGTLSQMETAAGSALVITQPPPKVTVRQPQPEITIRQPAPEVTVHIPEPEVEVTMPEPQVQGNQQARVEVQSGEPDVSIERTGEPEIIYEGPGQMAEADTGGWGFLGDDESAVTEDQTGTEMGAADMDWGADADVDADVGADADIGTGAADMQAGVDTDLGADAEVLRVGDVEGLTARTAAGERLGEIENIVRHQDTGEVYVIIHSGGFLGLGESATAVPFSRVDLAAGGMDNEITLDVAGQSELRTYDIYQEEQFIDVEENLTISAILTE